MRLRYELAVAILAVAALGPGRAVAQPEPTVTVRLRSVNDLLDKAEYVGGLFDQGEPVKQLRLLVKQLSTDGKGIEGIDPKRPFGAYAILATDVASSPVVVMVPVADRDQLLTALKDRLGITPEKADGGTLKVSVPRLNEVFLRFADDYLYIAREPKHIDAKGLVPPKAVFARDDGAVAAVAVRLDRIPDDLKRFALGQLELLANQNKAQQKDRDQPFKLGYEFGTDAGLGAWKALITDGKELSVKLFIDPASDELTAEVGLTVKDGSAVAANFASLARKTSRPAAIVAAASPLARASVMLGLTPDLKKRFGPMVEEVIANTVKEAGEGKREAVRRVLEAVTPTLKAGELDAAVSLVGPDAKGRHVLLAAVAVKDGAEIVKLLKDTAQGGDDKAAIAFDVEKVGTFALHKVELKQADADFERAFGTNTLWLATSPECIALSIEPDGARLKTGLRAKPAAAPLLAAEVAWARAIPVFEKGLNPDGAKELLKDAFGDASPAGKDTMSLTVECGDQLTARLKVKGKAFRLMSKLDEYKKK